MAVAFDSASAGQTFSNATSKSWTHTCSGSDRAVWVCVAYQGYPSAVTITAVTYGGTDITSSAFGSVSVDYGGYGLYTVWYELKNPPTTSNATVEVTFSGTAYGVAGSISATGVNQTSAHGTPVTTTQSNVGTQPTITVTGTTSGNLVLGGIHANPGGYTLTADQTSCWVSQERPGGGSWGSAERTAAGGDKVMSWTYSASSGRYWSISAFEALAVSEITGTASITQGANTISAAGSVSVNGSASITQGANTISAAGTVATPSNGGEGSGGRSLSSVSGVSSGLSGF